MNDEIREKLSAYLDGALSEMDRKDVEERLARSEDLRLELEALRAVSGAVKNLPKEKLPVGFLARLENRRARESSAPERNYVFLPPAYRPIAAALSTAVVALFIWDKSTPTMRMYAPRPGWESETVSVKSAAEAPASLDVSGMITGAADTRLKDEAPRERKENAAAAKLESTFGKQLRAPGKPLGFTETDVMGGLAGGGAGLAASAPAVGPAAPPSPEAALDGLDAAEGKNAGYVARNEEERSAINERLYKGFEAEKKRMGITRIIEKEADDDKPLASGGREMMALQATAEAARVDSNSSGFARRVAAARGAQAMRGKSAEPRSSPASAAKALALRSADALYTAWAAAGLPGNPPAIKFPDEMAVFLACPPGCGIVSVEEKKKFIVVLYKDAGFEDPAARVRGTALSSKPVVTKLAD